MIDQRIATINVFYNNYKVCLNLPPAYIKIMAGSALSPNISSDMYGDDSGENISNKNNYYSELTGIYWMWKNRQYAITGTCHYRRFFTAEPEPLLYRIKQKIYPLLGLRRKHFGLIYTSDIKLFEPKILTESQIHELLKYHDAILPMAKKLKRNVEKHYIRCHDANDLVLLRKIIAERHPTFTSALDEVLKSNQLHAYNMFVLKKDQFDEFMTWWFDILFEFEKQIDLTTKTGYQERIFGFIAERLLNIWFTYKKLNIIELPVIYFKKFKKLEEYKV